MASVDKKYTGFRHKTDLKQLYDDIIKTAQIADVPYNTDIIWRILNTYRDFFSGSSVAFRTTTKAKDKRGLNVRYIELGVPHDPYLIALSEGLIEKQGHPIDDLLSEIQSQYPILGYGVDFEVSYGLEKIWPFFPHTPQLLEAICSLYCLPDGIRNYADYFARYDLAQVNVFALDYRHKSINLYFPMETPGLLPPHKIAAMIADLEFDVPPQEVLGYCSWANPVYYTFSWDSPRIERLCFAVVTPNLGDIPIHLDPLIERFTAQVPFAGNARTFIYNITLARRGSYIKIENDYTECKW